jgi:hypothetical protein
MWPKITLLTASQQLGMNAIALSNGWPAPPSPLEVQTCGISGAQHDRED